LEATLGGKWLELLTEIAPGLKRAAFMFNPDLPGASAYMPSLETAARSLKVAPIIAPVRGATPGVCLIDSVGGQTAVSGKGK
jgi:putative ABC transport system substrate-binding protein